jgi:hypothetical protein
MLTAIDPAAGLDAVPDNPAAAILATRRKCRDGAFEAVENVFLTSHNHFKRVRVIVSAFFT